MASSTKTGRFSLDRIGMAAGLTGILVLAAWVGVMEARHLEFDPVNGHFQNFNAVSRLLAGQRPFTDFPVYLGLAPLLLPWPVFVALGGSLAASNFAYDALSIVAVGLSFAMAMRLCGVRPLVAWTLAVLGTAFPWPFERGNDSALGIRSFLPFLAAVGIAGLGKLQRRGWGPVRLHILAGAAAGVMPLWSNDYGLPSCACFCLVCLVCLRPDLRRIPVAWTAFALSATTSAISILAMVTGGHPTAWLDFNFGAVIGDQFWFYNPVAASKAYSLHDIPHGALQAVLLFPCAVLGLRWLTRPSDAKRGALAVLAMSAAGGAFVSGLGGTFELRYFLPLMRTACVLVPYSAAILVPSRARELSGSGRLGRLLHSTALSPILAVYALAAAFYIFAFQARGDFWTLPSPEDVYVAELGGSVPSSYMAAIDVARDLRKKWDARELPAGRRLLSTYATATSLVSGSRQQGIPDYLIHALGDAARARFATALDDGYAMVETMDPSLMLWGRWNIREAWPFYKKLYTQWRPVRRTPWSLLWEKREAPLPLGAPLACTVSPPGEDGFWKLSVSGAPQPGWTAEVVADITTRFQPGILPLLGSHHLLEVVEGYDGADRTLKPGSGFGPFMALVSNTWTPRLSDGELAMPLSTGQGRLQTLSLRAWPRDRASLVVHGCTARLVAAQTETLLPEDGPRGGTIAIAPRVDGPPPAEAYPARKDTSAAYMLTVDPLSPARVRTGDEVTFPDGRKGRVLMRDFRALAVEFPPGGGFPDDIGSLSVQPSSTASSTVQPAVP